MRAHNPHPYPVDLPEGVALPGETVDVDELPSQLVEVPGLPESVEKPKRGK